MAISNTTILVKKSATPGNTPSALTYGELAINYADGKLFYKAANGSIVSFSSGGGGSSSSFATINANSTLILASSPTDILNIVPGTNITILADSITKTFNVALKDSITVSNITVPTVYTTSGGIVFPDGTSQATAASGAATDQAARNLANTKTFTFYTNSAPATANARDLWVNSDTGVVYENFGTPSTPVWAEFGPTGVAQNTAPGILSSTQIFVNYNPSTTQNAAIEITAANTKGGTGYADFLSIINTSAGVTNPRKYFRINTVGGLEIINSAYTATPFQLLDSGDLTISGNTTFNGIAPGYAPNRPSFRVVGANTTNNLSITNNGNGQLNFNNWSIDHNQGSYLNNATGSFTAPVAGLYQINIVGRNSGNTGISQLATVINPAGANKMACMLEFGGSSTMNHAGVSTTVKLSVGDILQLKVLAGTINFDGNDNWSVTYIG